jgi:hypothetical protein
MGLNLPGKMYLLLILLVCGGGGRSQKTLSALPLFLVTHSFDKQREREKYYTCAREGTFDIMIYFSA